MLQIVCTKINQFINKLLTEYADDWMNMQIQVSYETKQLSIE